MLIDQATIDRIMDAAQIVDVVSDFVTLKRRGVNYVGLCPFHDDKTPSFYVSPSKGLCKCFACGKGGNAVHFIMEHEQMSYPEALRYLAKKYGIEIQERELSKEEKQAQSNRESMFIVNQYARDYFQNILKNHPDGRSIGMAYLRNRGFRDDIIEKFQIGYCTDSHDAMAKDALQKGYKKEFLVKTGLCYETDDHRLRDRFWGRVIFPVHTLSGKVIAFGGRVLASATKGVKVKYVNSPESEIYHKSNELYGIYFAKHAIVKQDRCFLVEGYTDVISMHQAGVENVVASSGTALTSGQIRLIHRFTNNITVLYDGDMAGIKASIRGIDMLLEQGMNIKVCLLPNGEDPDSFARQHNATEFQDFIQKNETDFIRFKTNLLLEDAGKDPIKRADLIKSLVQSIAVIPEAIVRDVYIKECGQLLQVEDRLLVSEVAKQREQTANKTERPYQGNNQQPPVPNAPQNAAIATEGEAQERPGILTSNEQDSIDPSSYHRAQESSEFFKYEQQIMQIIVRYGDKIMGYEKDGDTGENRPVNVIQFIVNDLKNDGLNFHTPIHKLMLEEAEKHMNDANLNAEHFFISHSNSNISLAASELANDRYQLSKFHAKFQHIVSDEERLTELVPTLTMTFKNAYITSKIKDIMEQLKNPDVSNDNVECERLMKEYQKYKGIENKLAKRLGDRVILHY